LEDGKLYAVDQDMPNQRARLLADGNTFTFHAAVKITGTSGAKKVLPTTTRPRPTAKMFIDLSKEWTSAGHRRALRVYIKGNLYGDRPGGCVYHLVSRRRASTLGNHPAPPSKATMWDIGDADRNALPNRGPAPASLQ